jgi:hypothetical protein
MHPYANATLRKPEKENVLKRKVFSTIFHNKYHNSFTVPYKTRT